MHTNTRTQEFPNPQTLDRHLVAPTQKEDITFNFSLFLIWLSKKAFILKNYLIFFHKTSGRDFLLMSVMMLTSVTVSSTSTTLLKGAAQPSNITAKLKPQSYQKKISLDSFFEQGKRASVTTSKRKTDAFNRQNQELDLK